MKTIAWLIGILGLAVLGAFVLSLPVNQDYNAPIMAQSDDAPAEGDEEPTPTPTPTPAVGDVHPQTSCEWVDTFDDIYEWIYGDHALHPYPASHALFMDDKGVAKTHVWRSYYAYKYPWSDLHSTANYAPRRATGESGWQLYNRDRSRHLTDVSALAVSAYKDVYAGQWRSDLHSSVSGDKFRVELGVNHRQQVQDYRDYYTIYEGFNEVPCFHLRGLE